MAPSSTRSSPSHSLQTRAVQPRSAQLLTRILDQPELVQSVRSLEPRAFGKLLQHIGLEDAGELVALATTAQLQQVFDEDLWRSAEPGRDETFDAERFSLWLEVMLEVGEEFAARKLSELPEDLVTLALSRQILVIDLDALAVQMSDRSDDDSQQLEKALSSALAHEFDGYQVIARREEGWDAILGVLVALDERHREFLLRIFERCAYASSELLDENGGLYNVLTAEEMLESDAAAEREDRRAGEGYVAPTSAVSFLALARTTALHELVAMTGSDPLTRAYFRDYRPADSPSQNVAATAPANAATAPTSVDKLLRVLQDFAVLEEARPPRGLLTSGDDLDDTQRFKQALAALFDRDPQLHARRRHELSYLANVLIAGASLGGRSFRPLEAAEAAVAVCNLGCEHLSKAAVRGDKLLDEASSAILLQHSADKLFRIGWHILFHDVVLVAARTLERLLSRGLKTIDDRDVGAVLGRLERDLKRLLGQAIGQSKPWLVRGKLDVLDVIVDVQVRTALELLIDECPRLATSTPEGLTFIATRRQVSESQTLLSAVSPRARLFQ